MNLTPLIMNAAEGLLQNEGLCANTENQSGYAMYLSCPLILPLVEAINIASTNHTLTNATLSSLSSLSPACPPLSNSGGGAVNYDIDATATTYSTLGITSLVGQMISNIDIFEPNNNIVTSTNSLNLVNGSVLSTYANFNISSIGYQTPGIGTISLIGSIIEYPSDGNMANVPWIGKSWAQDQNKDAFVEKLNNLYLGAGGVLNADLAKSRNASGQSLYNYAAFAAAYNNIQAYMSQINQYINSAIEGQSYLHNTFTGMSDLITGTVSSINPNIKGFAKDLNNLGKLINMDTLNDLGSPINLVQQIISVAGYLPILSVSFLTVGIDQPTVGAIGSPSANITDNTQKLMYKALSLISGDALNQILRSLNIKTGGLSTAADLLNPKKLFPSSYKTLKTFTSEGYKNIYSGGGVNSSLKNSLPAYVLRSTA